MLSSSYSSSSATIRVEKATSDLLMGPDWTLNMDICDSINANHWEAKDAVKAVKKRLQHRNPKVQLLALTLLETMVKNCGEHVHFQIVERNILQEMLKIVKKKLNISTLPQYLQTDFNVRDKILVLLDSWQEAFGGPGGKYPQYFWAYEELKHAGVVFPKRSPDAAPIFTPPVSHSTLSHAQAADMLQAVNPSDRASVKDEVIVDLVDQCRSNQKRMMQIVCLQNDAIVSGSHFLTESNSNLKPTEVKEPNQTPDANTSSPGVAGIAATKGKVQEDEDEEDDFAQLAQSSNSGMGDRSSRVPHLPLSKYTVVYWTFLSKVVMWFIIGIFHDVESVFFLQEEEATSDTVLAVVVNDSDISKFSDEDVDSVRQFLEFYNLHECRHSKTRSTSSQDGSTGSSESVAFANASNDTVSSIPAASTPVLSNALALSDPPAPTRTTKEQDMIDLLSITLSTTSNAPQTNHAPAASSQNIPQAPASPTAQGYPHASQAYPGNQGHLPFNQGQVPFNSYVVPWAQPQTQPQLQPQTQPQYHQFSSSYPPPPWAPTPGYLSNQNNLSTTPYMFSTPGPNASASYLSMQGVGPLQHMNPFHARGNNELPMNGEPRVSTGPRTTTSFVPSYRLFEDLNVLGNGAPSLSGMSGQSMVGGRK
ncbi:hypothetical protein TEA_007464 [Camellia sinensis var. sinensis]|uniref:VHS domain-containing protein n=1 Tax=Camellia sinensis var. sinensis TaxID=542762 RepID=A0A4S4E174_CAMSN|nr:hypothetical protein TEA_007464 [Camellia sinensis var. sinensis]